MRIATWNVNSIRQRLDNMLAWLKESTPDIVCLQEIKCVDEAFPRDAFESLSYNVAVHGQKAFNGVALLSKLPFDEVAPGLIGDRLIGEAREIWHEGRNGLYDVTIKNEHTGTVVAAGLTVCGAPAEVLAEKAGLPA